MSFIDAAVVDEVLAGLVADEGDRAFIRRCILEEGPIHHRGANYVLIALLARALGAGALAGDGAPATVAVPMRLPPHLADDIGESVYPIRLATAALRELAAGDGARLDAMVDCLTDGPAQHALANVVMVNLLDRLLAHARR